jgi:hypothetical protein
MAHCQFFKHTFGPLMCEPVGYSPCRQVKLLGGPSPSGSDLANAEVAVAKLIATIARYILAVARSECSAMRYAIVGALFALLPLNAYAVHGFIPADAVVMQNTPSGEGDPDAVTCRAAQYVTIWKSGSARRGHMGPEVCQTNQFWADLIKNHQVVDETGAVVSVPGYGIGSWGDVGGGVARSEPYTFDAHR